MGPTKFESTIIKPIGDYHNYIIGGNITNGFAFGEIGSKNDFFLIGTEPDETSNYPLLSGNILDSNGKLLFRLDQNILTFNPGMCKKILGDQIGYEIHDSAGHIIFKVKTVYERIDKLGDEYYATTLTAKFFNKAGTCVFEANTGQQNEAIEMQCKWAFGFSKGGSISAGRHYSEDEISFISYLATTKTKVSEPLRGHYNNLTILLDDKFIINAIFTNCIIQIDKGNFVFRGNNSKFIGCNFVLLENAKKIIDIYEKFQK